MDESTLVEISLVLVNLQSLLDAMIFGMNSTLRNELKKKLGVWDRQRLELMLN